MFKAWLAPVFAIAIFSALLFLPVTPYRWLLWIAAILVLIAIGLIIWRSILNKRLNAANNIQSQNNVAIETNDTLDMKRKIFLLDRSILILEWTIFFLLITLRLLNGQWLVHLLFR